MIITNSLRDIRMNSVLYLKISIGVSICSMKKHILYTITIYFSV